MHFQSVLTAIYLFVQKEIESMSKQRRRGQSKDHYRGQITEMAWPR